jgi:hypothetical protein
MEHNVYKSVHGYSANYIIVGVLAPSFCYIYRMFLEPGTVLLG